MGAGASTVDGPTPSADDVGKWSKEEVGEQVAAIGGAFEKYKEIVIDNDVDGETLLDLDDDDLEAYGVTLKPHRKKILKKLQGLKTAPVAPVAAAPEQQPIDEAARRFSSEASDGIKLFMSYPRGEETTPFARKTKLFLEARGFDVWMDEEGIKGGADFMHAIGSAIEASKGIVAIIDEKFCGST